MQIILLSGGSGSRLWPLSNDARSKQFLRLLPKENSDDLESMIQRVVRQLRESDVHAQINIATSLSQYDAIISQIGPEVTIITEPSRRDTFPAICLSCEFLHKVKRCNDDEVVVIMPCDPFTEAEYYHVIQRMAVAVENNKFDLVVMGIKPTYPSSKYGYVVPENNKDDIRKVIRFTEKPNTELAEELIKDGAFWNGGVFACRLSYLLNIGEKYVNSNDFDCIVKHYSEYPKISFDYEVVEKAMDIGMIPYNGYWKDLGTWNTITDELKSCIYGNVTIDDSVLNTHIFNELDIPLMCIGTKDLVIATSPDGILVSEKAKSEDIKKYVTQLKQRPMYEERRWGTYRVVDHTKSPDGHQSLTKRLTLNPGASISYQRHKYRTEVWTFIEGDGEIVIGNERKPVKRGDTIIIPTNTMHALKANTPLSFIEVQSGVELVEDDIERFPFEW